MLKILLQLFLICLLFATNLCFECKGNGYFRDPLDCAKMIRCSNGKITHRFSCSEGKVFNDITKSCDDPKYVNCQNSVSDTSETTSPPDVTTTQIISDSPIASKLQSVLSSSLSSLLGFTTTTTESTTISENITPESTTTSSESVTEKVNSISLNESSVEYGEENRFKNLNESFVEFEEMNNFNESFVTYEEKNGIPFNESFVVYEEVEDTGNTESTTTTLESIESTTNVESEESTTTVESTESAATEESTESVTTEESTESNRTEDSTESIAIANSTESTTKETTTESTTKETTTESVISSVIDWTTSSTVIPPTSVDSSVLPVLESILQNETLVETTASQTTDTLETSTKSTPFCAVDESVGGLRMISNNYTTNETSKLTDLYKIVCYFTNWSRYRSESARFTIKNINPFLCTHIIYSFAILDNQTLTMKSSDECTDIDNRFYGQITDLKKINPRLKILIALGGWVDSEGDKYSRLVNSQTNRLNFIENVIQFIERHNFDGLDLDWEYPQCWQANCSAGPATDKINFAKLIRELKMAFNRQSRPLLLTAAVGATKYIIDNAYQINSLMVNLDFINLMTYDFYTAGSTIAAHHSPLYPHPNAKNLDSSLTNSNFSVNYWIRKGVPSHKIILGIPFYGRAFKLLDSGINDFGAAVNGTGNEGLYTREKGFLAYYEICTNILKNGWAKRVDTYLWRGKPIMTGPYSYKEDQWVGYDDREHIIMKTEFIKDNYLGGAMVWALDLDDFNGVCCKTKSPLLKTINSQLREYKFDLKFFCP